jgi:hypothetical protein
MPLIFTPLTTDSFHRANESPINPTAWLTIGGLPGTDQLEIVNNVCVTTTQDQADGTAQNIAITWPENQFVSLMIPSLGDNGTEFLYLRGATGANPLTPCYRLTVTGSIGTAPGSFFYIVDAVSAPPLTVEYTWADFLPLNFHPNDVFTFAVSGQSNGNLFVYQNEELLFEGALNLNPVQIIASGEPGFQLASESDPPLQSDAEAINFVGGSVSSVPSAGTVVHGRFKGSGTSAASIVQSAFPQNFRKKLDLMQVISGNGGKLVWKLDCAGNVTVNPTSGTNGTVLGEFVGDSWTQTFVENNSNPYQLDLIQIADPGENVLWFLDYTGAAHSTQN